MAEPLGKEVVEFEATGLTEIIAETKRLEDEVKRAYAAQMALNAKLNDPVWRAQRGAVQKLAEANRQLEASSKKVNTAVEDARESIGAQYAQVKALNTALKDPATLQRARDTAKLAAETRQLLDIEEKLTRTQLRRQSLTERSGRLRSGEYLAGRRTDSNLGFREGLADLRERRAALASGQFGREVVLNARLQSAADQLTKAERRAELTALHGRLAAGAMLGLERARPGMLAAGVAGGVGLGMARSGLSGTVEGNALSMEMHLLNRELAGAILPAVKDLTRALRWVRQKTEKLTGGQQDVLGYGMLAAGGLGFAGLAAGPIMSMVGVIGKLATGLRGGAASTVAAQLAGGAAGQVATNAGSSMVRQAGAGAAGGAATTAGGGLLAKLGIGGLSGGSVVGIGLASIAAEVGRAGGRSKFFEGAREGSGRKMLQGGLEYLSPAAWFTGKATEKLMGGSRRTPMIADAGFEDFDESYRRVATTTALQAAVEMESGGKLANAGKNPQQESADTLKLIWDFLNNKFGMPNLR